MVAGFAQVLVWRATENEHGKSIRLARDLARAQVQIEARESVSELFVNLARRNQALLDRQINLLVAMEERQADPDELAELFQLDHLATRIRRNAESLLVLSGEEPARRWGRPVPMAEVVRAAIAEVEDFRRADMDVDEGVAVAGRAVADLAHLLAELVENGLQFSPPESRVRVTSRLRPDGACVIVVEDHGIGMSDADLTAANDLLAHPPEVDLRLSKRLGFHVVARLAARYRMSVRLSATPGGGVTVGVSLPDDLVAREEAPIAATETDEATTEPAATTPAPVMAPPRGARPAMPVVPTVAGRPLVDPSSLPVARRTAEAVAAEPVRAVEPVAALSSRRRCRHRHRPSSRRRHRLPHRRRCRRSRRCRSSRCSSASRAPLVRWPPTAMATSTRCSADPPFRAGCRRRASTRGMRNGGSAAPASPVRNGVGGRSPEELRAQLSQFQAAQAHGRNETSMPGDAGHEEDR